MNDLCSPTDADVGARGRPEPDEDEFLATYRPGAFAPSAVTVDVAILTIRDDSLCVLAIQRGAHPYKGRWALPGGFVNPDEDLDTAAARELHEETGMVAGEGHLEQLRTYGAPRRDPRMRVVSVAYVAFLPDAPDPVAGSDAAAARFVALDDLATTDLAFDHDVIVADAVERARSRIEYTNLATAFVGDPFTIAELRRVYEVIWGCRVEPNNFRRKVTSTEGFIVPTGEVVNGRGRPAPLYRKGPATVAQPAMLRPAPEPEGDA